MTESVFNAYSRYYDLLYRDKDYAAEVEYIDRLLQRHGATGSELLEFGSGTGKHGRLLAQRGYQVVGIERSADMVAQAKQVDGFQCQVGDISTVQLGRTFDAVLSLFHVISYQISNEDVRAVFARAAEHLSLGGLFIFDVWYSPAVFTQRPSVRVKRLEGEGLRVTRIAEPEVHPNENRVDVNYQIFAEEQVSGEVEMLSESHPMRHFSLPELDLFAKVSGFERVGAEEFLSGNVPSEETWGVCLIFKRV
jgi:SAM-dependent methyltransferase